MQSRSQKLKSLLQRRAATLIPGVPNALFARVAEDLGYEAIYVTGAGVANMQLGVPDIGLTTLTELIDQVAAISDAVEGPRLVDGDTGFGNAVNTMRTVRLIERAGADEMVAKIKAAVDARIDPAFQIVARTDALAIEGVDAALDRAHAFIEAGADVTFVEAPTDRAQMARIAKELPCPQIANIVHGGKTPPLPRDELASLGFSGVLYANAALQAALLSVQDVLGALRRDGSLDAVRDKLASFDVRQAAVRKDRFDALEERYR